MGAELRRWICLAAVYAHKPDGAAMPIGFFDYEK
jgi:hypothetical protein